MSQGFARTLLYISRENDQDALVRRHRFAGTEGDKKAAALWLRRRLATTVATDRVIVTNGTQNSLLLLLSSLVGSGETLLAEPMTYPQLVSLCELLRVRVRPVEMDASGILPDAFARACRDHRPKALYTIPTVHNPTTAIMPESRRLEIIEVARRFGVALIEDDAQGMLPEKAPPPMGALAPDITWYVMSVSKCLSVGLRVGYVVAPTAEDVARVMAFFGRMSMWFAAPLTASIVARWIERGTAEAVLAGIREEASYRQNVAIRLLENADLATQPNALHMWLKPPAGWSVEEFVRAAEEAGVLVRSGQQFVVDRNYAAEGMRVSLADPSREELTRGLSILAELAKRRR